MRWPPATLLSKLGGFTLTDDDALRAVREITLRTDLAGADVVEVSPPYDPAGITAEVAHCVVMEVLSALAAKRTAA